MSPTLLGIVLGLVTIRRDAKFLESGLLRPSADPIHPSFGRTDATDGLKAIVLSLSLPPVLHFVSESFATLALVLCHVCHEAVHVLEGREKTCSVKVIL